MSPPIGSVTPTLEYSSSTKRTKVLRDGVLTPLKLTKPGSNVPSPSSPFSSKEVQINKAAMLSTMDSTHIVFDFDLQKDPGQFFEMNKTALLMTIFPETEALSFDGFFLIFQVAKLPPKPWPKTVAGVSIYLTTVEGDEGPRGAMLNNPARLKSDLDVLENIHARKNFNLFRQHVGDVFEYFRNAKIEIFQLQYWRNVVILVLKDKDQASNKVPRTIMQMPCYILFEDDVKEAHQPALRLKQPKMTDPPVEDDSQYDVLRPGVMVSSEVDSRGQFRLTTCGVLVQDNSGNKYVTVAAHGFPKGGTVYHPRNNRRAVGTIAIDFSARFDIALVALDSNEKFVNETFDSAKGPGSKLTHLAPITSLEAGDTVCMDNVFMGRCDGKVMASTFQPYKVTSKEGRASYWHKTGLWVWEGQNSSTEMPGRICGTALVTQAAEVGGFLRFVGRNSFEGMVWFVAAENLRQEGFEVCQEYV